ncbi:MAG TPA: M48 family metallopeptidase [Candidatus Binatia bacterium]|nr:M48 family metallopeptidase [Candidatus Binatia bacterium]
MNRNGFALRGAAPGGPSPGRAIRHALICLCFAAAASWPAIQAARDNRTQLKPGWNLFTPQDDIKLGLENSQEAEKQLPMLRDARVEAYLSHLGKHLAEFAPGDKYPYQFRCVNTAEINAFALPGGYVYVNRGTIQAADDEAQLAAVMGHEISHVALRHGTTQVTKSLGPQLALGVLGGVLGNSSLGQVINAVGAFSVNSLLLKYSRADESQADILGTQIIHDAGYDPRGMSQFFVKLEEVEKKMGAPPEFFSNHPSPEHRIERVNEEIANLGGPPANAQTDSAEFREIRKYLYSLPPAPKQQERASILPTPEPPAGGGPPEAPAASLQAFENSELSLRYPSNWKANGQGSAVTLAPPGGVVPDARGNQALAYGMIVNQYSPSTDSTLASATDQFIAELRRNNAALTVQRRAEPMLLNGQKALSAYLVNDSPVKGKELIWLITTERPDGLLYILAVAPQNEYDRYSKSFEAVVRSMRFPN